jgi:hypothetical protein
MKPLRTVLVPENCRPAKIAGVELADGGQATVRTADGSANAEAALGEVESVANLSSYAVIRDPSEQGSVNAALQDEVFDEAADGVVGQRGRNGGAQAKAAAQAASYVVFAAALPDLEVARGVDAVFAEDRGAALPRPARGSPSGEGSRESRAGSWLEGSFQ